MTSGDVSRAARARCMLIVLSLSIAGCDAGNVVRVGAAKGVVFSADKAGQLLKPCSRERPAPADGHWLPVEADIQLLEQALPRFLESNPPPEARIIDDIASYKRQYVGVIRKGRRSIYVNFFAYHPASMSEWTTEPVVVCDGGARFFGAEFDMSSRQFTHVAYNGVG